MPNKTKGKGKPVDVVLTRKIKWNRKAYSPKTSGKKTVVEAQSASPQQSTEALNKHASNFKRELTDHEKTIIKVEFLKLNGIFPPLEKHCTRIKNILGNNVSVFQVSGEVSKLHKLASSGAMEMVDRRAYLATIRSHRKHWLTYRGEKYDAMRLRKTIGNRQPKFGVLIEKEGKPKRGHRMTK